MTKQEVLDALEGLKDMVSEHGKGRIESIRVGVMALKEDWAPEEPEELPKTERSEEAEGVVKPLEEVPPEPAEEAELEKPFKPHTRSKPKPEAKKGHKKK